MFPFVSRAAGRRSTRVGWTGSAALSGGLLTAAGMVLLHLASGPRQLCHVLNSLDDLAGGEPDQPLLPRPSCASLDERYVIAVALTCVGSVVALVALVAMARRAWSSRRAGHPWWLHRAASRVAAWIDAWLPGQRRADGRPRISSGFVTVLGALVALGCVSAAFGVWSNISRTLELRTHHRGQVALATLQLPTGLTLGSPDGRSAGCTPSPDTLCASSALPPDQVDPILRQLLHGKPDAAICALLPTPAGTKAPCAIYGRIGGYRAMAIPFNHLLVLRSGAAPPGAVPVRPGNTHMFYLGTDVTITLLTPEST